MHPFGAKAAGVHNSPVPAGHYHPLVLDMATSVAADGKLTLAADKGIPLGEGWALDQAGNPTTDPNLATILLPSDGPKGSGLALMFQCLTSLMANNPLLVPALQGSGKGNNQNSVVAAIDIGLFTDVDTFKSQVDDQIDSLKALPKADGLPTSSCRVNRNSAHWMIVHRMGFHYRPGLCRSCGMRRHCLGLRCLKEYKCNRF